MEEMIRLGKKQDINSIMQIVSKTVEIMRTEKNDQWDEEYPTSSNFEKDIENESLYVLEESGEVVGSITVDQNEPIEYKPISWRKEGPAYTFHRLVVSPQTRGKGAATKLISNAEKVALANHVRYMRIDTYSLNKKAQQLFEKNGYKKAGEMFFQGRTQPFYCYDKLLES